MLLLQYDKALRLESWKPLILIATHLRMHMHSSSEHRSSTNSLNSKRNARNLHNT